MQATISGVPSVPVCENCNLKLNALLVPAILLLPYSCFLPVQQRKNRRQTDNFLKSIFWKACIWDQMNPNLLKNLGRQCAANTPLSTALTVIGPIASATPTRPSLLRLTYRYPVPALYR